jgi:hypothetical protein
MNIDNEQLQYEKQMLKEVIADLDNRLADFKEMLSKMAGKDTAHFTANSLSGVEKLLDHIRPVAGDDTDLIVDAALYIGETVGKLYNGVWDISDNQQLFPDYYLKPVIRVDGFEAEFCPFEEVAAFAQQPGAGYFLDKANEKFQ